MKTLFLLRHCETNQFEENINDFEKKLNEKGKKDAILLNKWFIKNNIILDCILTSSASRTLQTTNIIFNSYKEKICEKKELYLCSFKKIIEEIKYIDNKAEKVIVIGHEPSISESLKFLIFNCRPDLDYVTNSIYPSGGLAVLHFNTKNWAQIEEKTATLDAFVTPKYLEGNEK